MIGQAEALRRNAPSIGRLAIAVLVAAITLGLAALPAIAGKRGAGKRDAGKRGAGKRVAGKRPFLTGVTNLDFNAPLEFARTRAAGAHFVRIPLHWGGVAPSAEPANWQPEDPSDPRYHWDASDDAVIGAVQAGLAPVLLIDGGPVWAQRCQPPFFARTKLCDPDPAALAAFATAAARHYSGQVPGIPKVSYWQALNEPNLSLFFNPQFDGAGFPFSPGLYRELLNSFYAGVKSVDPSNLVVAAGLGPNANPPWTMGPMRFARALLCMHGHRRPKPTVESCGGGVNMDIFAIQPYSTGGPTHEGRINDVPIGALSKLQTLIAAADRAGRIHGAFRRTPLWITEFSWDTNPPDPGGLTMEIASRWSAEALYLAWKAGVTHFFWYSLRDGSRGAHQPYSETLESGLFFRGATLEQDQPKAVLEVFRNPFVAYPRKRGLFFWGRTPDSTPGKVAIQTWTGRRWRNVRVTRAGAGGVFTGIAKSRYGKNKKGMVRGLFKGQGTVPFAMRPIPNFPHQPFG